MSIAAPRAAKPEFQHRFGRGSFGILSLFVSAFTGCASSFSPEHASGIDARYRWARIQSGGRALENAVSTPSSAGSPGVRFYQSALSRTLGSDCDYFPSDSRHAQMMFRRCGSGPLPVLQAMARSLDEPNAPYLGYSAVTMGEDVRYFRLKESCSWVD